MTIRFSHVLTPTLLLAATFACSGQDGFAGDDENIAEVGEEIRFGTVKNPWGANSTDVAGKSVVKIGGCSATVIEQEWVLTAKHCNPAVNGTVTSIRPSGDVLRSIDKVFHHATADVSLAHVSRPFLDIPRVTLYGGTPASIVNKTVRAYGFGAVSEGRACTTSANCLAGEFCQTSWSSPICMLPSAERELRSGDLLVPSNSGSTYRMNVNAQGQLLLPGDSGGPSFIGTEVTGVHSTTSIPNFSTDVSVASVRDWILASMNRPSTLWAGAYSDAGGWNQPKHYQTLTYPDLNADNRADVCGRGTAGIACALSNGTNFGNVTTWDSSFSDANGWISPQHYQTVQFPDINGDRRADVCGRGGGGIWCATSTGTTFTGIALKEGSFSDANGWSNAAYYSTIKFPDINGDGRADVCGRGGGGVWCATSNGATFTGIALWSNAFSDGNGWAVHKHYSTLQFPDLNGDHRADVCGRGSDGMWCALSTGTSFGAATRWSSTVSDAGGWDDITNYSTLRFADVNGDGRQDACGRGDNGTYCMLSTGTAFGALKQFTTQFRDADGGNQEKYYSTMTYKDIDSDGRADLCARGIMGILCYPSTGSSFLPGRVFATDYSDTNGWGAAPYYSTLEMVDVDADGMLDVCGRGGAGVYCAP